MVQWLTAKFLLVLVSTVTLGSEYHGTHGHVLLSVTTLGDFKLSSLEVWIMKYLLKRWSWMQNAPPEHRYHSTGLHGVTTQKGTVWSQLLENRTAYPHFRYARLCNLSTKLFLSVSIAGPPVDPVDIAVDHANGPVILYYHSRHFV